MMNSTKTKTNSYQYISALNNHGYEFKLSELSDLVYVNCQGNGWKPLSDTLQSVINNTLRDDGFSRVNVAYDAIVAHAHRKRFHPIRDYLSMCKYDRAPHINRLTKYFDNPDNNFSIWLRRWLIGAVQRVMALGYQNRMLVMSGPQNIGKSKFVEWLVPEHLRTSHFFVGPICPENKDQRLALMDKWIWEVSELGSTTRKADREALKYFLTLEQVTERKPYGRLPITKPALTSFFGTVNDSGGLLSDPTGNRRFLFSQINSIDWKGYTNSIDVNQIWGEAYHAYLMGEAGDLLPDEQKMANKVNKDYEIENPLESVLVKHFDIDPSKSNWCTPSDVIREICMDPVLGNYHVTPNMFYRQLADIMTTFKVCREKKRVTNYSNPVWCYLGVKRI